MAMIEVEDLHKRYGPVHALRGISFAVERGVLTGFLGPNGAGKSTTLRILAGFLGATEGRVRVSGFDLSTHRLEAAQKIGYMPETSPLYPEMKIEEYLRFRAELKGVSRSKRVAEVGRACELTRITDRRRMLIRHLSKGYRQRVGLADALLGRPPLLILDEPTAGFDPNQVQQVRALLDTLREDHTIFLSTHILSEVEATCEEAVVIHEGRVVATGSIEALRQRKRAGVLEVTFNRGEGELKNATLDTWLTRDEAITSARHRRTEDALETWRVTLGPGVDASAIEGLVAALVRAGAGIRAVEPLAASLEEVFADLTGGSPDDDDDVEDEA